MPYFRKGYDSRISNTVAVDELKVMTMTKTDSPESPDSPDSPESPYSPESQESQESSDSPDSLDSPDSSESPESHFPIFLNVYQLCSI